MKLGQTFLTGLPLLMALAPACTDAQAGNTFNIVSQADWAGKRGFYLNLECREPVSPCPVTGLKLVLAVADGSAWRYVTANPGWEFGRSYAVKAVVSASDCRLWIDGREIGARKGGFEPAECDLVANCSPAWDSGPTDYLVFVERVKITSGSRAEILDFSQENSRHIGLVLLEPQCPRRLEWKLRSGRSLAVEATFRLAKRPDVRSLAPFVDKYGQCRFAEWPGKIRSDFDLRKSAVEESRRLDQMGEAQGYDKYGGSLAAEWKCEPTGFYRVVKRDGFWWLVTPEGNPCFYVGLCTVSAAPWDSTLVTGREFLFESLPPRDGPFKQGWIKRAMGESEDCDYLTFYTPNMAAKYGEDWQRKADQVVRRRMACWGFSGVGKWAEVPGLPVVPVLNRAGVPNAVDHPDVFDPEVRTQFERVLRKQVEPRLNDPMVVGWSLGNEIHEIIKAREVEDILAGPSPSPIKRAFVNRALAALYGGDVSKLSAAWGIKTEGVGELCSSPLKAPADDVESLRRFYASEYYGFIFRTVKKIDPNHLYFGFWIVPGWWENEEDWRLAAPHCDVIGYDLYSYDFNTPLLMRLAAETDKPIFCGEFSFPAYYRGSRGFGAYQVFAEDDADSGRKYARWLEQAARNPYCVGALWFHYRDQMITGRGPGRGPELVLGEHYAFGVIDVADRPKWDLVERMRAANLAAFGWRTSSCAAFRQPLDSAGKGPQKAD